MWKQWLEKSGIHTAGPWRLQNAVERRGSYTSVQTHIQTYCSVFTVWGLLSRGYSSSMMSQNLRSQAGNGRTKGSVLLGSKIIHKQDFMPTVDTFPKVLVLWLTASLLERVCWAVLRAGLSSMWSTLCWVLCSHWLLFYQEYTWLPQLWSFTS